MPLEKSGKATKAMKLESENLPNRVLHLTPRILGGNASWVFSEIHALLTGMEFVYSGFFIGKIEIGFGGTIF